MTKNTLVLVGCADGKRDDKTYAWDLYEGDYFAKKMTVGMLAGTPAVLSAEHGYLPVTKRIEPYDLRLSDLSKDERDEWGMEVVDSIPDHFDQIMFLAGAKYRDHVIKYLSDNVEVINPLEGMGIGSQKGWLKEAAMRLEQGESLDTVLTE